MLTALAVLLFVAVLVFAYGAGNRPRRHLALVPLLPLLLCQGGCASIVKGSDPVVVNAERSIQSAFDTCDEFIRWEDANRVYVKTNSPQVHAFAESLRRNAPTQFTAAWHALREYKAAKTLGNGTALDKALAVVQGFAAAARQYLADVKPSTPSPGATTKPAAHYVASNLWAIRRIVTHAI